MSREGEEDKRAPYEPPRLVPLGNLAALELPPGATVEQIFERLFEVLAKRRPDVK